MSLSDLQNKHSGPNTSFQQSAWSFSTFLWMESELNGRKQGWKRSIPHVCVWCNLHRVVWLQSPSLDDAEMRKKTRRNAFGRLLRLPAGWPAGRGDLNVRNSLALTGQSSHQSDARRACSQKRALLVQTYRHGHSQPLFLLAGGILHVHFQLRK